MTCTLNLKPSELKKFLLIGASTGGPGEIEKIINALNPLCSTSIVIAQHMVDGFLPSFMNRLGNNSKNRVTMALDGCLIEAGTIYVCSGHTQIIRKMSQLYFLQKPAPKDSYNPDINLLFSSFSGFTKDFETMGVILTGIGEDGVNGCNELSLNGAQCITENEHAIVDGMPSRARLVVANIKVSGINEIIETIREFCE
ncbi:MAG: CheB methylesterase domain-containing protein [Campylobacterales bacterium]|nr:CheB methylesterase domain-containing protein [Campylobacterales bacterium]